MFEHIKQQRREARGEGLRRELEDVIVRLNASGPDVNARALLTLAMALRELGAKHGHLDNISNDEKARLAKQIRKAAERKFAFDIGAGYGLSLLSMHIESQAVPGNSGRIVQFTTRDFVKAALQLAESDRDASERRSGGAVTQDVTNVGHNAADGDNPVSRFAGLGCQGCGRPTHREWIAQGLPSVLSHVLLALIEDGM